MMVMRELVLRDVSSWPVQAIAQAVRSSTVHATAQRIYDVMREGFAFEGDPPGVELLRNPAWHSWRMIREGDTAADCDELSMLIVAALAALGLPAALISISPPGDDRYRHVFAALRSGGTYFAIDPQEGYFGQWPEHQKALILPI